MAAYWRITEVRVLEDNAIWVRFTDDLEGVVRFSPDFFRGVFSHLNDPAKFREVAVVNGAVTWPGGLDLAPDAMYHDIKLNGERLAGNAEAGTGCRLGFMAGEFSVPDNFDRMGGGEIENLFSGRKV